MIFREEIGESLTLKFAAAANERRKKGLPIISLGLGEPDFNTPLEIINSTIDILKSGQSRYSEPMGINSLREKISLKLNEENNIKSSPRNILITAGAKPALQLILMSMLEPENEIIVLSPSFVSFIPQIYIAEPRVKIVQIDVSKNNFSFDVNSIEKSINSKTKAILINTPNNPAGYIFPESQLREIFNFAHKYNLYIISDEIYEKLVFPGQKHFSIGSFENSVDRVITINGFSKSHAMTGWRLGYACFPEYFYNKLQRLQQHINTNTCTFIQQAVDKAFYIDQTYLSEYRKKLNKRALILKEFIDKNQRLSVILPGAGFFAFVNIKKTELDSNTFCSRLIEETGVATTPGIAFGRNWDDHIRISFAVKDEILRKGIEYLTEFTNNL